MERNVLKLRLTLTLLALGCFISVMSIAIYLRLRLKEQTKHCWLLTQNFRLDIASNQRQIEYVADVLHYTKQLQRGFHYVNHIFLSLVHTWFWYWLVGLYFNLLYDLFIIQSNHITVPRAWKKRLMQLFIDQSTIPIQQIQRYTIRRHYFDTTLQVA